MAVAKTVGPERKGQMVLPKEVLRGTWGQNEEEIKGYLEGERGSWEGGKG